ncbi:MAG: HAD superfamily hydrolase [Candidatus Methanohalarchaeum thermophilum]|uniref:HAD superfamily hydrolase n=1 Tax=Methanohalarchaeum thermophilum TaxID=1903181 RepID=A0A1Q6DUA9_METT1|nr:MAG: HAD superfamily hydrolase [Candidatus Methanohalarchaeum thermophilum]
MTIFFDLDGTLCDVKESRKKIMFRCLDKYGLPKITRDEYRKALQEVTLNKKLETRYPIFKSIFEDKGCFYKNKVQKALKEYKKEILSKIYLYPDAENVLRNLDISKVLVTNGPSRSQWDKINKLNIEECFSGIIISGEFGYSKPDSKIFEHAKKIAECCNGFFVGNSPRYDIYGAKKAGLKTILVDRNGEKKPDCSPDYKIKNLNQLNEIV